MSIVSTMARKELRELSTTRSTVIMGVVSCLFFALVLSDGLIGGLGHSLTGALFITPLLAGLSLGYYGCSQVFLREKTDFVIETLLCSPASIRDIWIGKTLGATLFADSFALGTATLSLIVASLRAGVLVFPGATPVVYLTLVLPLSIACMVGARGYAQLLMGMRDSHLVSLALLMTVIFGLHGMGFGGGATTVLSLDQVVLLGLAATVILTALVWSSRFLSRERIVISL